MLKNIAALLVLVFVLSCSRKHTSHNYTSVTVENIFEDTMSIRAIEFLDDNTLAFAGSNGFYGTVDVNSDKLRSNRMQYDSIVPSFRAVAHTTNDFFMLSIDSPALLYKTGGNGQMELVYKEEGEGVFYDAMSFWNNKEGLAIGDYNNGCFAIIITRDGGETWNRLPCQQIPDLDDEIGAYAASNTNIAIQGDKAWVITSKEKMLFTADKGKTWQLMELPIDITSEYLGIYSIDFYDELLGYGIGGDFNQPEITNSNKVKTIDGGNSWQLIAGGQPPGYKSCVRFIPNSGGNDLVAVGYTGISYSKDGGTSWSQLSDEGFFTVRFLNDSIAYAGGWNRIAKLSFK